MARRNSSIETLRIVSMAMVLTVHFVGATFGLPAREELWGGGFSWQLLGKAMLEAFAIVGVNCFVLISGYYGIRASLRGLLNFTLCCLFAALFVYFVRCADGGRIVGGFWDAVRVYSNTDLWFVPAYLALYLLSPLLNGGMRQLSGRQTHWMMAALLFINVYLGWLWGGKINPTGYNVMQMILLYYTGFYIRRHEAAFRKLTTAAWLAVYAATAIGVALTLDFAYNNPLVMAEAVALFMVFAGRKPFESKAVNWVASSAFMVYLIHKSPYMWLKLRAQLFAFDDALSPLAFAAAWLGLLVGVFVACVLIDKVRQTMFKPLFELLDQLAERKGGA